VNITFRFRSKSVWRRLTVAFFLLGVLWISSWLAAKWLIVSAPLERADLIVVLSGSSTFLERTHVASELYHEGRAKKIVLTNDNQRAGWSTMLQRNPFFHEIARWELERLGVPVDMIVTIEAPVSSTHDEAVAVQTFASSHDFHSVLIVTSAYHSRRALSVFRKVFDDKMTTGVQAAAPGWQTPLPSCWWFSVRGWQMVPGEYCKIIYYSLVY